MKRLDLCGCRFGRLTVEKLLAGSWYCRCDCGNFVAVRIGNLRSGNTRSCGCLQRKRASEMNTIHGAANEPEFDAYTAMIARCTNSAHTSYRNYGARGVRVCDAWMESFWSFIADVGSRPSSRHSLDRIDNNGHYESKNVRWATRREQMRNCRINRVIVFNDESACLQEWSERVGLSVWCIAGRLRRGWSVERALTTGNLR